MNKFKSEWIVKHFNYIIYNIDYNNDSLKASSDIVKWVCIFDNKLETAKLSCTSNAFEYYKLMANQRRLGNRNWEG